jgi:hypothetical protein
MRSTSRAVLTTALTVLVLGAVGVTSASAAQWYVSGKALTGTASLSGTVKVVEPIVISTSGLAENMKITCQDAYLYTYEKGSELIASDTLTFAAMGFENCALTGLSHCSLADSEISTEPVEATFSTKGLVEDIGEFTQRKKDFMALGFYGSECDLGESTVIVGKFAMKMVTGQQEKTEQEFVGEGEASKGLEIVGWGKPYPPVYITGKFKLKLASGDEWSFH